MEKNWEGRIWSISKKTMFPLTMDDVYLLLITLIDRNLSGVLDKILVRTNCLGTDKIHVDLTKVSWWLFTSRSCVDSTHFV